MREEFRSIGTKGSDKEGSGFFFISIDSKRLRGTFSIYLAISSADGIGWTHFSPANYNNNKRQIKRKRLSLRARIKNKYWPADSEKERSTKWRGDS